MKTKKQWAETFGAGDKVLTSYPDAQKGYREATIESITFGAVSQSGVLVKLKEVPEELDLFWIAPNYSQLESAEANKETVELAKVMTLLHQVSKLANAEYTIHISSKGGEVVAPVNVVMFKFYTLEDLIEGLEYERAYYSQQELKQEG